VLLLIQLRLSQIRQPSKFEERQESVVLLAREKMEMQEPKGAHAVAPPPTAVEAGKPAGVGGVVQSEKESISLLLRFYLPRVLRFLVAQHSIANSIGCYRWASGTSTESACTGRGRRCVVDLCLQFQSP
jgi:hypothetical protein